MILSQTSEYALRIMTCIAVSRGARPMRAKDIAKEIRAPSHYVSKVLCRLVKAKLLRAERGHGGGFTLARPAEQIHFRAVIAAIGGQVSKRHCIFGWRACDAEAPCVLHHRWQKVSSSFEHWARTTTLADIQDDAQKLNWLIGEPVRSARKRSSLKK